MVFRECAGIGSESEVVEYKAAMKDDYHTVQAIPGRLKWNKITLKRGLTDGLEAWTWRQKIEEGKVDEARADGSITMVDQTGKPVAQWEFYRAWPSKISGPELNASTNEIGVEVLEIVHEGLIRKPV
jgi:phage tail-like protein